MTKAGYTPRHGYDIRVKPTKGARGGSRVRAAEETRVCEHADCAEKAAVRTAETPRTPEKKIWLCAAHAAEHNKKWNYFDGLNDEEAAKVRRGAIYGDRPTWKMGSNERSSKAARTRKPSDLGDAYGLFGDGQPEKTGPREEYRNGRRLPRLQVKAFQTLDLKTDASGAEIRKRYAELLRRFHPDANGGDRSAETQLQEVVRAHHVLKKAGIC